MCRVFYSVLAVLVTSLGTLSEARAQVTFRLPSRPIEWDRYTKPQECLSAVKHTRDSVRWVHGPDVRADDPTRALPEPVVEVARRCLSMLPPGDRVVPKYLDDLRDLALFASRDSVVQTATDRRVREDSKLGKAVIAKVLRMTVEALFAARPARVVLAEQYREQLRKLGDSAAYQYGIATHAAVLHAMRVVDTARMRELSTIMVAIGSRADVVRQEERDFPAATLALFGRIGILRVEMLSMGPTAAMDSIEKIPVAMRDERIGARIGRLPATIWFGRDEHNVPAPGKVTLIVMGGSEIERGWYQTPAFLHRFAEAFPDVERVLVRETQGKFRFLEPPPDSVREAEFIRRAVFEEQRLPVTSVAVVPVPTRERALPDGRVDYGVVRWGPIGFSMVHNLYYVLVSHDGRIAAVQGEGPDERYLHAVTRALLAEMPVK